MPFVIPLTNWEKKYFTYYNDTWLCNKNWSTKLSILNNSDNDCVWIVCWINCDKTKSNFLMYQRMCPKWLFCIIMYCLWSYIIILIQTLLPDLLESRTVVLKGYHLSQHSKLIMALTNYARNVLSVYLLLILQ